MSRHSTKPGRDNKSIMNTTVITVTFLRPPKTGLIYDSAALKKLKKISKLTTYKRN